MNNFPVYADLAAAAAAGCFNCGTKLDEGTKVDTGFPDGRIRLTCPSCGYFTYFDLKKETA